MHREGGGGGGSVGGARSLLSNEGLRHIFEAPPPPLRSHLINTNTPLTASRPDFCKLADILQKFPRCALVCKRWYRLCQDESLWKRLDLGLRTVPPGVIGQAAGHTPVTRPFLINLPSKAFSGAEIMYRLFRPQLYFDSGCGHVFRFCCTGIF